MVTIFWQEFGILLIAAIIGSLAIMPYSLRLLKGQSNGKPLKMPISTLLLLSLLQNAIIFAIVIWVGLTAAHSIGLGASYIEAALLGVGSAASFIAMIEVTLPFGILAGAILLILDLFFLPYWPELLIDTARKTTTWENFSASFYGGINEELLMRLFGLSILAWIGSKILHTPAGLPTTSVFWTANAIMAILFAIGHLPALKKLVGEISTAMLVRALSLNIPVALMCGWLFWNYGIESAIIAHFSADIVYHVFGTSILRRKLAK